MRGGFYPQECVVDILTGVSELRGPFWGNLVGKKGGVEGGKKGVTAVTIRTTARTTVATFAKRETARGVR